MRNNQLIEASLNLIKQIDKVCRQSQNFMKNKKSINGTICATLGSMSLISAEATVTC